MPQWYKISKEDLVSTVRKFREYHVIMRNSYPEVYQIYVLPYIAEVSKEIMSLKDQRFQDALFQAWHAGLQR